MIKNWQDRMKDNKQHTITGNVKIIQYFGIPQLKRRRRVWIYLPPGYDMNQEHYPVLYLQDGQNVFDEATAHAGEWHVDESIDILVKQGRSRGAIVVAVDNGKRYRKSEYCPGPEGDLYADFIVNTLKPFIDKKFRTSPEREYTGIAGSSLGGVIALYVGMKHQNIFSKIGAFSPAVFVGDTDYSQFSCWHDMRIYIDVGTHEVGKKSGRPNSKEYLQSVVQFYQGLKSIGYQESDMKLVVEYKGLHSEANWGRRFMPAFEWLYEDHAYMQELKFREFSRWEMSKQRALNSQLPVAAQKPSPEVRLRRMKALLKMADLTLPAEGKQDIEQAKFFDDMNITQYFEYNQLLELMG